MQGYVSRPDPNRYAAEKWVGKRVVYNGTTELGTVLRAFWGGPGKPAHLIVDWDSDDIAGAQLLPLTTDSEHVTLWRKNVPTS